MVSFEVKGISMYKMTQLANHTAVMIQKAGTVSITGFVCVCFLILISSISAVFCCRCMTQSHSRSMDPRGKYRNGAATDQTLKSGQKKSVHNVTLGSTSDNYISHLYSHKHRGSHTVTAVQE